ncbi:uncharacterized protein LOC122849202 [Aphidius gifuensis]|uniref:uncharacterized protein LOC122849202 n=1 Tax=Aphidius gifuensis TaxID=684658 RepID=UPI001CDD4464|nr:uncharacterized protein LOC122849202 [Aphidius gifuensis]
MNEVDSLSTDEDENMPFDMLPAILRKNKRQFTETLQSVEKKTQQPSPTKEELQLQIKELLKKVNSKKLKKAHVRPITWESTDDNNDKSQKNHDTITSRYDDHRSGSQDKLSNNTIKSTKLNLIDDDLDQLYGKDFPNETMKHIGQNIYCKRNIYKFALTATSDTSIARRLLEGVFKRETLLEATITGRSGTNKPGATRGHMVTLSIPAVDRIIEFAHDIAITKTSLPSIRTAMAQRLGELRREARKNANV